MSKTKYSSKDANDTAASWWSIWQSCMALLFYSFSQISSTIFQMLSGESCHCMSCPRWVLVSGPCSSFILSRGPHFILRIWVGPGCLWLTHRVYRNISVCFWKRVVPFANVFSSEFQAAVNTERRFMYSRGEVTAVQSASVALLGAFWMKFWMPSCQDLECPEKPQAAVFLGGIYDFYMLGAREANVWNHNSADKPNSEPITLWMFSPPSMWKIDFSCQLWPKTVLCYKTIANIVCLNQVSSLLSKTNPERFQTMITPWLLELPGTLCWPSGKEPWLCSLMASEWRGERKIFRQMQQLYFDLQHILSSTSYWRSIVAGISSCINYPPLIALNSNRNSEPSTFGNSVVHLEVVALPEVKPLIKYHVLLTSAFPKSLLYMSPKGSDGKEGFGFSSGQEC